MWWVETVQKKYDMPIPLLIEWFCYFLLDDILMWRECHLQLLNLLLQGKISNLCFCHHTSPSQKVWLFLSSHLHLLALITWRFWNVTSNIYSLRHDWLGLIFSSAFNFVVLFFPRQNLLLGNHLLQLVKGCLRLLRLYSYLTCLIKVIHRNECW